MEQEHHPDTAESIAFMHDISAKDIFTWIADYACHHRLEDIINELFGNEDEGQLSVNNIPATALKIGLIWHTIVNDEKDNYADAVSALDSFLTDNIHSTTVELCLRLALGLRMKDLVHGLALPLAKFRKKMESHFPEGKYRLDKKYLSQVFDERGLQDFEATVRDVCAYFSAVAQSKQKSQTFIDNYSQSRFGKQLTEKLKTVAEKVFEALESRRAGTTLEQLVQNGPEILLQNSSCVWNVWLSKQLAGITELKPEHVRSLLQSLRQHTAEAAVIEICCEDGDTENSNAVNGSQMSTCIPSSDAGELSYNDSQRSGKWPKACPGDHTLPNLRQFLKPYGIRGCVVVLDKL